MEQVVTAIRTAIDNGRMTPGVKYSVYQLADQLSVSRTPVRDALLRLEEAGLIRFEARQGFRIMLPHPQEIADIFAVRLALELPAVRRAAARCNTDTGDILRDRMRLMHHAVKDADERSFMSHDQLLHDHILDSSGNARARKIVASLRESTRLLGASTADRIRTLSDINDEHTPIVAAIVANDPDAAERAMSTHLVVTGRLLVTQAVRDQKLEDLDVDTIWNNTISA
ncbi:GntR family transcriptional regulator [Rhodococcus sp. IEGM 1381]|uniref:GntR family transcriptional regulator n=1 Tax=Rhodococcus sp. IEGM 1381 TaxID=3047085 RepID=UPI0024B63822|nr:GntR family transcriptional regulator [Rhodococcus sp. IEGM 1381]MDI9893676.1 GntR family transcriptional regulator [Rhodococcus sp. IEGM 1381]